MSRWHSLITLMTVIPLSCGVQLLPDCSQLRQYAMPHHVKNDLATNVVLYGPKRGDVSVSLKYECALEGMAGLILENPGKPLTCPDSLGMHALVFDIQEEPGIDVSVMTKAAIDTWKTHIPHVTYATSFGCNYRKEYGTHKYLCLLKGNREFPYEK